MSHFRKLRPNGQELLAPTKAWSIVLDTRTNLEWIVAESKRVNWKAAHEHVKTIKTGGGRWRLPTVEELFFLADRSRHSPAIDPAFFPKCKQDWYWSSTPAAATPADYAWLVLFGHGGSGLGGQADKYYVRAVRPRQ